MTDSCKAYIGDCREVMRQLIAEGVKVQTCVTSPPYWGLRDYKTPPLVWGGAVACVHEWGGGLRVHKGGPHGDGVMVKGGRSVIEAQAAVKTIDAGQFCQTCGAWRGSLGLEPTPQGYVDNLVEVFRLVRELLTDDGTVWLNLGDSYASTPPGNKATGVEKWRTSGLHGSVTETYAATLDASVSQRRNTIAGGLKPKDLCGIPWRVAFALQADGWYLRQDIIEEVELYCPCGCGYVLQERIWRYSQDRDLIWKKPNPMPESVTDRCTKAHEYIFLLSKRERYYYDADAIREKTGNQATPEAYDVADGRRHFHEHDAERGMSQSNPSFKPMTHPAGRNKRSVWTIATQPYSEAHFATFPLALIEPCILAGSRPGDIVLDPFFGSGTVGEVSQNLGRKWIGIDLNPEYESLQRKRTAQTGLMLV